MTHRLAAALIAALLLGGAPLLAQAGGQPGTRDQLRQCLQEKDTLALRRQQLDEAKSKGSLADAPTQEAQLAADTLARQTRCSQLAFSPKDFAAVQAERGHAGGNTGVASPTTGTQVITVDDTSGIFQYVSPQTLRLIFVGVGVLGVGLLGWQVMRSKRAHGKSR